VLAVSSGPLTSDGMPSITRSKTKSISNIVINIIPARRSSSSSSSSRHHHGIVFISIMTSPAVLVLSWNTSFNRSSYTDRTRMVANARQRRDGTAQQLSERTIHTNIVWSRVRKVSENDDVVGGESTFVLHPNGKNGILSFGSTTTTTMPIQLLMLRV
jgi:hypothetical protein